MTDIYVRKSDGSKELLDFDKIHKVLSHTCDGLSGVSVSEVATKSQIQFNNGIKSTDIHFTLIKTAASLITEKSPNYAIVAGRLLNIELRKKVYGKYTPDAFYEVIKRNIKQKYYSREIFDFYNKEDIEKLETYIVHSRDERFTFGAMSQFDSKYLVRNKISGKIVETPQIAYMLVSMVLFHNYPKEIRFAYIRDYYDAISKADLSTISLPTPISAGVRTPTKQFSSCVIPKAGDSLESISALNTAIVSYVSKRAGIGADVSEIRPQGSSIRGGEAEHTGFIPFAKTFQASTHSCSQGAIRKGSSTIYYPIFHVEIESLLVLKNNKGTEDNRVRHIDYGVQINKHFYQQALAKQPYYLFDQHVHKDLYNAFFEDDELYAELYDAKVAKKQYNGVVDAYDLFIKLLLERASTGRKYIFHVDLTNIQTPFDDIVYSSNLCLEIALPTRNLTEWSNHKTADMIKYNVCNIANDQSYENVTENFGEIALCTLSAINWGRIKKPSDFEKPCDLAVRALDELLDYQDYPMIAAEIPARARRNLGIGIINFAHWLAKQGLKYGEGLEIVDEYMEAMYFYLMKTTIQLAKEKGACAWSDRTCYSRGVFMHDLRKKSVDKLVPHNPKMDWDSLRADAIKYGVRNSTLIALMPAETSATISNSTNGIEPVRKIVTRKSNKDIMYRQIVPNVSLKYDMLWEMKSMKPYLSTVAVLQKYIDQAPSTNTSYNPELFPESKVSVETIMDDVLYAYSVGIKTLYYHNTFTDQEDNDEVIEEEDSESDCCKI